MTEAQPKDDPARVLEQAEWARVLARKLARDPWLAEDLAQGALLAALHRAPMRASSPPSLRAWLSRVLSNGAREVRREEAHRRAREETGARPERLRSTAEVVARAETLRAVVAAVLALPEPYREAVLLHHFDGLPAARIAERCGASEAAVRQRLSRGRAMLRERLAEEDPRGRFAALLALSRGGGAGLPWSAWIGAVMSAKTMAGATVVAVLATLFFGWQRMFASPVAPEEVAQFALAPEERAEVAAAEMAAAEVAPERTALAPIEGGALRVVDAESGRALAGAELRAVGRMSRAALEARLTADWRALGVEDEAVRWLRLAGEEAIPPDPFSPEQPPLVLEPGELLGATDAEGRFPLRELRSIGDAAEGIVVTRERRAAVFVPAAWLADEAEGDRRIELPRAATLRARLVDAMTGAPVTGAFARVELELAPGAEREPRAWIDPLHWRGPSDEHGELAIEALPAGVPLWVTALGDFSRRPAQVWIDPEGGESETELRVWRVGSVRGRLVREDGAPVEGLYAFIRGGWATMASYPTPAQSGADGTFLAQDIAAGRTTLRVQDHPYSDPIVELDVEVPPGDALDVGDVVVPERVEVSGRVLLPAEVLPGELELQLWRGGTAEWARPTNPDGRFSARVVAGEHALVVKLHVGWSLRVLATRNIEAPASGIEIDLTDAFASLSARLPEGFPDVPCFARLYGEPDPVTPERKLQAAVTRETRVEGEAITFELVPPGKYDVELSFGDLGSARFEGVELRAGRTHELGLISTDGGFLEGTVVDAEGEPVAGAVVLLEAPPRNRLGQNAPPLRRGSVTDDNGRYGLGTLDAGLWTIRAEHPERGLSELSRVAIHAAERSTFDLELHPASYVRGRVTRRGIPAPDVVVGWSQSNFELVWPTPLAPGTVRPAADGSYAIGPFRPGEYTVRVNGGRDATRRVRFQPGEDARVDFELEAGIRKLRLELDGEPLDGIRLATVVCIDPRSPLYLSKSGATTLGGGWIEASFPPALCAIEMLCDRFQSDSNTSTRAFVDGATLAGGASVALPEHALEVELGPDALHRERPKLHLLAVPGGSFERFLALIQTHPYELEPGLVRFVHLPAGARCLLVGPGPDGRRRERELSIRGDAVQRERWD